MSNNPYHHHQSLLYWLQRSIHYLPDTIPLLVGLQVEGWCQGDSVYFSVTNTGDFDDGDMDCYSPVWLTVDGVVTDTDSLQIQGGETVIYSYPAGYE